MPDTTPDEFMTITLTLQLVQSLPLEDRRILDANLLFNNPLIQYSTYLLSQDVRDIIEHICNDPRN